jgi:hypothetical protein
MTQDIGFKRSSGLGESPDSFCSLSLTVANAPREVAIPVPAPRYDKPETPAEKLYCSPKTVGNVVKSKKRRPNTNAQRRERRSTMGDRMRNFVGRTIARRNSWRGPRPRSIFDTRAVLPVSFRREAAFQFRSTAALVSWRKKIDTVNDIPA